MKVNKYWLLTIAYCLVPITFALSLSFFVRRLPDIGQLQSDQFLWIYAGHPVSQTLVPDNDGLNVITVYLKNVSLRNQDPFYFTLSDASGVIRSINLTGYNIGDGDNVRFQFAPIQDSRNLTLTLTLASNCPQSSAVGVGYSGVAHSIAYQAYYFPTSRISVLKTVTINFLKSLFQFRFIIIFLGLFCLSLVPLNIKYEQK